MEPIMLVTLIAVGFAVLALVQHFVSRKHETMESKVMRGYFLLGLSGLMAKIAMADGVVTDDETALATKFFKGLAVTDAEKALCIGNFITSRREKLEARDHAKRFMAYANRDASEFLYDMLWRMSRADGKVDACEDALLKDIATYLGLDESFYLQFKAGKHSVYNLSALRDAGVPASLVKLAQHKES